ncbi:hypothetical protein [Saccharopolyspora pogona]|uniref:hypothetical protein n=1 Tax=Saccharopolyspora pogona TaxID=333966 RepID=UPI001685A1D1|nr:hypothetical protein [Saccharopolyspora pogona]
MSNGGGGGKKRGPVKWTLIIVLAIVAAITFGAAMPGLRQGANDLGLGIGATAQGAGGLFKDIGTSIGGQAQ